MEFKNKLQKKAIEMRSKNELRRLLKKIAKDKKITWKEVGKGKGEALSHTCAECLG